MTDGGYEQTGEIRWPGALRADYNDEVVQVRDLIADAARAGHWASLQELLTEHPDWVNAPRLNPGKGWAPLHQAAYHGADAQVIEWLLAAGAWRSLRTADRKRAVDIARERGHRHLVGILGVNMPDQRADGVLEDIETYLHALIKVRTRTLREGQTPLWLPQAAPLLELTPGVVLWFGVPGMYGGFSLRWDGHAVLSSSWNRVVGHSGQDHRITRDGVELVADETV